MKLGSQGNGALESLLESLTDACLILDEKDRIHLANERARQMLSLPEDPRDLHLSQFVQNPKFQAMMARARDLAGGLQRELTVDLPRERSMEQRYLAVSMGAVQLKESGPPHLRILIRDETERQAVDRMRKDFVANASQELRTPLSIINGYLENLVDGVVDDPAQMRKCLLTMRRHSERIARIAEDMLTLATFEAACDEIGPRRLRQSKFSISDCVNDVLERLHPAIEAVHASIQVEIAPDADLLAGDRFYWDQVIFNLVENALKENVRGLVIKIECRRAGRQIQLSIRDNGVGIPREDLPFVFRRFYRVAQDQSPKARGAGLGLSLVRRAVEAHGGTITVDSNPAAETIFTIVLPDVEALPKGDPALDEPAEGNEEQLVLADEHS